VKHHTGVSILPAPLHPTEWRNLTPQHIEKTIDLLTQGHDYVVIDTPGTFNEIIATTLELGDMIMLVTSMDIASIKDTALALEMLRAADISEDKVKLVINHSTSSNSLREDDVERVLEYPVTWRIPHDYNVANSNQLGIPIVVAKPYARVSRAVNDMAYALSGVPRERKGFLERFLGRTA
jgi:pilus assembly protein CpaE